MVAREDRNALARGGEGGGDRVSFPLFFFPLARFGLSCLSAKEKKSKQLFVLIATSFECLNCAGFALLLLCSSPRGIVSVKARPPALILEGMR